MTSVDEATAWLRSLDRGHRDAMAELRSCTTAAADAERAYLTARAQAWRDAPDGTTPEREAWVCGQTADLRHARDLTSGAATAALEEVRWLRSRLSAWQTETAARTRMRENTR